MTVIDQKTVNALVKGDKRACTVVIDALYRPVYRFALKLCGTPELAEDITQETFLAVWQGVGSFKGKSRFKTWVFGIAYRQFLRIREKKTIQTIPLEDQHEVEDSYDAYKHMQSMDVSETVRRAMDAMPDIYRQVVFLVFIESLSYREASEVLDVPLGTIKSRMNYAFNIMREELRENEVLGCEM